MGIIHRPQAITPLVYYPIEYYFNRPQDVFGPGEENTPGISTELFEETVGDFGNIIFDEGGGSTGFVKVQET